MLRVHRGDTGPRVVLLQALLNAKGASLTIDGLFGPKTQAALVAFQDLIPLRKRGEANEDTWPALVRDSGLEIVDAVDAGDPDHAEGSNINKHAGTRVLLTGAMSNGVQNVVRRVIQQAGAPRSIGLLRLWGHGNLGRWLTITVGDVVHTAEADPAIGRAVAREWRSYLDLDHFEALAPTLPQWRPYFAPFASVEHHGCSLARVAKTRTLMHRLADLWDVPVTAGFTDQWIPYDKPSAFRFQGRTYTAYPRHENLSSWARSAGASQSICR